MQENKRNDKTMNCKKSRKPDQPYEIWKGTGGWEWHVLKKYQNDDNKPFARAFCKVYSPFVPNGELGDVYIKDIHSNAHLVESNY